MDLETIHARSGKCRLMPLKNWTTYYGPRESEVNADEPEG
jgi:hypothetical protein